MPVDQAYQLSRAFAFYFELINLAETNHRKRRRLSLQLSGETGAQRGSLRGTLREMRRVGITGGRGPRLAAAHFHRARLHRAPHGSRASLRDVQAPPHRRIPRAPRSHSHPRRTARRSRRISPRRDHRPVADRRSTQQPPQGLRRNQDGPRLLRRLHLRNPSRPLSGNLRRPASEYDLDIDISELPLLLGFGSWIGGDRDGNPFVTPEVTREAIRDAKSRLLAYYDHRLQLAIDLLTTSAQQLPVSAELRAQLDSYLNTLQISAGTGLWRAFSV